MADEAQSEKVFETARKVMETNTPTIEWMTGELADHLLHMFSAARAQMMMRLMRQGVEKADAEQQAGVQIPLLCFQLGLMVGKDIEGGDALARMFEDPDGGG